MTEQDLDKLEKQVKELMTVGLHYSTQQDIKESDAQPICCIA